LTRTVQSRLKRQRAKRQAVFLVAGCALVVGVVLLVFELTSPRYPEGNNARAGYAGMAGEAVEAQQEQAAEAQGADAPPLSLGLGGDVSFGLAVADILAREDPAYPWTEVSALFGEYDFTAVNLEGPLCRGGKPNPDQPSVNLRGDASCAGPMAAAGIDAVSLANDHIMDYGASGLEETLNILRAEKLGTFGAGSDRRTAEQPLVLRAEGGASVALLSFSDVAPASYAAGEDSPGVSTASTASIEEMVGRAAEESSYVVVFMHWGGVGSAEITPRQRELARICVRAGADLVAGCHPRVVQGMELIDGVPVLYSLGNLLFSADSEEGKNAIFAGCRFAGGRVVSMEIIPLRVEGAKPARLEGEAAESVLLQLKAASPGVELEISPEAAAATLEIL
jgi:poly-gamma-glutamate capsule biosynthesis protein CapA/YwtB (metallophosphatase superfamily)